jgi:OOP family OmpA-OmpF porin
MKPFARFSACALLLAFGAPAYAGPDPESEQMLCDLAGQCGSGPEAVTESADVPPARGAPRSGATRGFTFKRQAPTATSPPPADAAPAVASNAPRVVRPAAPGASNLRLSFASGSARLTDTDKARLAKLAQVLDSPQLSSRRVRIEGHTDAVGSVRANQDLSRRRAESVAAYLRQAGTPPARLEVVGLGSSRPLPNVPAQSPENRRVMAVILN